MEIFVRLKPCLALVGFWHFNHPMDESFRVSLRILTLILLVIGFSTSLRFIFHVETFSDFAQTYVTMNTMCYVTLTHLVIWKRWQLLIEMISCIQSKVSER